MDLASMLFGAAFGPTEAHLVGVGLVALVLVPGLIFWGIWLTLRRRPDAEKQWRVIRIMMASQGGLVVAVSTYCAPEDDWARWLSGVCPLIAAGYLTVALTGPGSSTSGPATRFGLRQLLVFSSIFAVLMALQLLAEKAPWG